MILARFLIGFVRDAVNHRAAPVETTPDRRGG
jgi:hypothetical protein